MGSAVGELVDRGDFKGLSTNSFPALTVTPFRLLTRGRTGLFVEGKHLFIEGKQIMERKLGKPVTLVVAIEAAQHDALRYIAYREKRSLAAIAREALDNYIKRKLDQYPKGALEFGSVETLKVEAATSSPSKR